MKAQLVKNAVIVPTGAKGGFYPKQLAAAVEPRRLAGRRHRKLPHLHPLPAVGHRQYRRRTRSSIPSGVVDPRRRRSLFRRRRRQGHRDLLRRRQRDRDRARLLARRRLRQRRLQRLRPQGDGHHRQGRLDLGPAPLPRDGRRRADASRSASPAVGDMSGDVFGNGMLLSKAIKLVAAFDHRHIFLDPDPDPAKSWEERKRMFELPRSSWDDYDRALISKGGGIFPRSQKSIPLSPRGARGARHRGRRDRSRGADHRDPQGAGRPALVRRHRHLCQGARARATPRSAIPATTRSASMPRSSAPRRSAKAPTSASPRPARIEFAEHGGRINTDFIDNSRRRRLLGQ